VEFGTTHAGLDLETLITFIYNTNMNYILRALNLISPQALEISGPALEMLLD
jgi:hypothetical protein